VREIIRSDIKAGARLMQQRLQSGGVEECVGQPWSVCALQHCSFEGVCATLLKAELGAG